MSLRVLIQTLLHGCAALMLLLGATSAHAQRSIAVDKEKLNSLAFSNLIVRVTGDTWIGIGSEPLKVQLIEHLRRRGFPALGAESLVFGQDKSNQARFLLGGTVDRVDCARHTRCRIAVVWELFDRSKDAVVYRMRAQFAALDLSFRNPDATTSSVHRLVHGALDSLLSRPKFIAALTKTDDPKGPVQVAGPMLEFQRCAAPERQMPAAADDVLSSTVLVETDGGFGSGTFISPDGLILTAAHVVKDGTGLKVKLRSGETLPVSVVRYHKQQDVALLRAQTSAPTACLPLRLEAPKAGEEIYAIGSPAARELAFTLTRGIVSGTPEIEKVRYLQTDASVNPGNSGGPMIDSQGRVAAVISWKIAGGSMEGIAFGVPVAAVENALGVKAGEQTAEALKTARAPTSEGTTAQVLEDVPDALPTIDPEADAVHKYEQDRRRRAKEAAELRALRRKATPPYVKALKWGGLTLGLAGSVLALGSYLAFDDQADLYTDYTRLRLMNDIAWVSAGLGTASLITGIVLTPKVTLPNRGHDQASSVQVRARLGFGSGSIDVRF